MQVHKITSRRAQSFWTRAVGFLFSRNFNSIFFPRCNSIHTFFMKRNINLVWVNEKFEVLKIENNVPQRRIKTCKLAFGVFEFLTTDKSYPSGLQLGDQLQPSFAKSFWRDDSGNVLVELALVLPVLLLFIFGFIAISRSIAEQQKLTHTANYSVQTGALTNDDSKITGAAEEYYDSTDITIQIESVSATTGGSISSTDRRYNDILMVQIIHPYDLQIPFLTINDFEITATASARVLCTEKNPPYVCE
ncbi:MAG: pilus assembly protein [Candidatus Peregrinibacteria bacterium]|nr:pilus assembly protein [Candidatus Peregrinibacteria bacterium]